MLSVRGTGRPCTGGCAMHKTGVLAWDMKLTSPSDCCAGMPNGNVLVFKRFSSRDGNAKQRAAGHRQLC